MTAEMLCESVLMGSRHFRVIFRFEGTGIIVRSISWLMPFEIHRELRDFYDVFPFPFLKRRFLGILMMVFHDLLGFSASFSSCDLLMFSEKQNRRAWSCASIFLPKNDQVNSRASELTETNWSKLKCVFACLFFVLIYRITCRHGHASEKKVNDSH